MLYMKDSADHYVNGRAEELKTVSLSYFSDFYFFIFRFFSECANDEISLFLWPC
uniref:Uncharacterized protein n=1 Tax=Octopus bimaculoides TaxID=37653 RepID=A0A0L8H0U5_OCTBM